MIQTNSVLIKILSQLKKKVYQSPGIRILAFSQTFAQRSSLALLLVRGHYFDIVPPKHRVCGHLWGKTVLLRRCTSWRCWHPNCALALHICTYFTIFYYNHMFNHLIVKVLFDSKSITFLKLFKVYAVEILFHNIMCLMYLNYFYICKILFEPKKYSVTQFKLW